MMTSEHRKSLFVIFLIVPLFVAVCFGIIFFLLIYTDRFFTFEEALYYTLISLFILFHPAYVLYGRHQHIKHPERERNFLGQIYFPSQYFVVSYAILSAMAFPITNMETIIQIIGMGSLRVLKVMLGLLLLNVIVIFIGLQIGKFFKVQIAKKTADFLFFLIFSINLELIIGYILIRGISAL
ncbi:hypothetical protein WJT86_00320 [Microvirga sp. W0021]|uniref:Uncharacterized protein n=1 Tax=Hohaiivirga grylli TaxID=3133970 RepID=A0ABV0BEU0_9HYPH